jgi:hypothetical protein
LEGEAALRVSWIGDWDGSQIWRFERNAMCSAEVGKEEDGVEFFGFDVQYVWGD